ncbi:MAG: hypothetical protein KDI29_14745, partial [Pseudomonadales bacterium]|nr:hypothetical protein [Pseudomonadales bacterium]
MLEPQKALALYHVMLTARLLDQFELAAVNRGEAWFHISGSGHESSAILNEFLQDQDWLSCHYRDKALLLGRGVSSQEFLNALYGNAESYSGGRQMNPFTSCRARNVMNMSIPVGNGALQCVGVATSIRSQPDNPIVLCSIGDGTSQQGEVLEAIAEAVRSQLPVLFFIQDNQLAVSTKTRGKTFFSHPDAEPEEFYGLPIHRVDGREVLQARQHLAPVIEQVRASRGPAIVIFRTCRLDNHSNADDQSLYRSVHDLEQSRLEDDPLGRLENALLESGITDLQLDEIKSAIQIRLAAEESRAKSGGQPTAVKTVKAALPDVLEGKFNPAACQPAFVNCTMRQAINRVLRHHLSSNHSVFLYGEDIEDPKGDVFGVTRDLSNEFSGRVLNSPLSESTIVGLSIGRALAGDKPVCFIQFADFIPHALNQIMSELATLYWRSNGEWSAPVIVMIACGAYRPGLGPFHAQSMEALMAQVPGLDVFYPSNAGDAAGLLNSAFLSGRPSIFFYPKNALNRPEDRAPENIGQYFLPIGDAIQVRKGNDLSLLAWGNTLQICLRVAVELSKLEIDCDVIDLACISPWDKEAVLKSVQKTGRMIVVEENTHTCGFGAEVAATVAESATRPVLIRRITGPDSYLPFNFDNQRALLPSFESILATAAELLDLDLDWQT